MLHAAALRNRIQQTCLQELSTYKTSTREDEATLEAIQGPSADLNTLCHKLALQYRMQHKRAVARAHKRATQCLRVLRNCTSI